MTATFHEHEEVDRIKTYTREAIEACKELAVRSRGNPYKRLIDALHNIEGSCRVLGTQRGDYSWLPIGLKVAECHKRAGGWLRGRVIHGIYLVQSPTELNQNFVMLAQVLQLLLDGIDKKYTAKTGKVGPVLPTPPAEERRVGRPAFAQTKKKPSLILPPRLRTA